MGATNFESLGYFLEIHYFPRLSETRRKKWNRYPYVHLLDHFPPPQAAQRAGNYSILECHNCKEMAKIHIYSLACRYIYMKCSVEVEEIVEN